jgi:hypothetical protein
MEENKFKFPTEVVELPSKGLIYPEGHPLASGTVEMKYMTAKEEDILTNQNYIARGMVIDKLLQSLIITKFDYNDLLVGDKNAILIAARILGYGADYEFTVNGEKYKVDLTSLENKPFNESLLKRGENEFSYTLPHSKTNITFCLMTEGIDKKIDQEIRGLQKVNKNASPELTTRLKHIILSVEGDSDTKTIRDFVDTALLARDARALREHIAEIQPDIDLVTNVENSDGDMEEMEVSITTTFFYPDL